MSSQQSVNRVSTLSARGLNIALVVSVYNESITERLLQGARSCLEKHGANSSKIQVFSCPGAFELPQVAKALSLQRKWDAVICLGAVVRGETPHFDFVATEAARGIQNVALESGIPVVFGVLTTNNMKQAKERSGGKHGNKGWEAALTGIEMARLFRRLERRRRR